MQGRGDADVRAVQAMSALAREHLSAFEAGAGGLARALRPAFLPLALTGAYLDRLSTAASPIVLTQGSTLPAVRGSTG